MTVGEQGAATRLLDKSSRKSTVTEENSNTKFLENPVIDYDGRVGRLAHPPTAVQEMGFTLAICCRRTHTTWAAS
jgi:hypothetical protein